MHVQLLRSLLALGLALGLVGVGQGMGSAAFVPIPPSPVPGIAVDGVVRAVVVGNGVAYVGGDFTSARGSNGTFPRARVAAFNVKTGEVLPFRSDASAVVRALALRGSSLFVGGDFTTISGQSRSRLAEVDAGTGALVTGFKVNATGSVRAMAVGGDRLYVGGNFGQIAGVAQPRAAAIDLTTRTLATGFRPTVDATVAAVTTTATGDKAYFGGGFVNFNGQGRRYLAGVDAVGASLPVTFALSNDYGVQALDLNDDGSRVFAAIGGSGNQAAAFNATTGTKLWRQRAMGDVQAVAYEAGNVYFGFHEGFENDLTLRLLAADAQTGALENFRPPVNSFYGVRGLGRHQERSPRGWRVHHR
ncbi:MAG: PQQ-binding-like beta-propeller repeat protein [Candidatus Nanopelagicales bacterium]